MYILRRFHRERFDRFNAITALLHEHLTDRINLIGSATLPLPEVCQASSMPAGAVRVEGHVGNRYFPGTHAIDAAEELILDAVSVVFDLGDGYEVSSQLHSATQANHVVWRSFVSAGDAVMGLSLHDGGHISHVLGLPDGVEFHRFPMNPEGIDYEQLSRQVEKVRPKLIVAGGSSYPLSIDYKALANIATQFGSHLHADLAHSAVYIAGGIHAAVAPYADTITIDTGKNLRGPKGGILVYREADRASVRRSIFPVGQSSPNQSGIIAKALLFEFWRTGDIKGYARQLVTDARLFERGLEENTVSTVFGETESHIVMADLSLSGITGREAEARLEAKKVLANRNLIPGDPHPAWIGSGVRFGTSNLTILGFCQDDIQRLAAAVSSIILDDKSEDDRIVGLIQKYHKNLAHLDDKA